MRSIGYGEAPGGGHPIHSRVFYPHPTALLRNAADLPLSGGGNLASRVFVFAPIVNALVSDARLRLCTAVDDRLRGLTGARDSQPPVAGVDADRSRAAPAILSGSTEEFEMATAAVARAEEPAVKFGKEQLKSFVERIERLEEEKKTISDDIRDVYAEAKGSGFEVKALRAIVRMRKEDTDERREYETILETYMHALGML